MAISNDNSIYLGNTADMDTPQLPIDAIIHIMSYLTASDRMSAGLVSRAWREASLARRFLEEQQLVLECQNTTSFTDILNTLQQSMRPFYHFTFIQVEVKRNMPVWEQFGPQMQSLNLLSCNLSERTLVSILKCCDDLRTLRIHACQECLLSGRLLDDENDVKELSDKFQHLRELSLAYNRYLSDALFNRLVAICPNLESLNLTHCHVSFHCGVYKKFYPQKDTNFSYTSKSLLTFLCILYYFKQQVTKLKHLDFGFTLIDGTALATLSALEGLRLESLKLMGCDQLTIVGIKALTQHQTCLKVLDVSLCTRITDASLVYICKKLKKLESLKIRRCRAVTDCGIRYIRFLRNLKELDISEGELLTGDCITNGLCYDGPCNIENGEQNENWENVHPNTQEKPPTGKIMKNENLEKLYANALHLHEESIECICKCFPNLRLLELKYSFTGVTDKTIQMIFEELVYLHTLKISYCDKVSDAGLTGMGANNSANVQRIQSVPEVKEPKLRISLRSRAEEEIVRDADRKREVMKLCEDASRLMDLKTFPGYSLTRLRGLRELDLAGCNRISDVSLKHAFAFPELKILNLRKCQQITHIGLDYLSRNNPAIEHLDLTNCYNVTDIGISYVAKRLHRLKQLLLQDCTQLTDHTLDSIKLYCKSLRYLDVTYCEMTIGGIESLTHLYVAHTKQNELYQGNSVPPPAPPLPYSNE